MRRGIARNGEHLYPAFPYDHFTHVSDGELDALYAWLMTRRPLAGRAPATRLAGVRLAGALIVCLEPALSERGASHPADPW